MLDKDYVLFKITVEDVMTVMKDEFEFDLDSFTEDEQDEIIEKVDDYISNNTTWYEDAKEAYQDYLEEVQ
jgi:hypothetical protein